MTDRFLFDLAPGWARGADDLQWMLLRGKMRGEERYWNPVSFVASSKSILLRVLREKGVQPSAAAKEKLDALPDRFCDWHAITKEKPEAA